MASRSTKGVPSRLPSFRNHGRFEYDVFLSFRGEDTCNDFAGLLRDMLRLQGIHAFFDEEDLDKGANIGEILEAISNSRILIPIFSKRYAESKWCLREVAKMVECDDREQEKRIIPVFFDVDPKDVRSQTGPFNDAFQKHQTDNPRDVEAWKEALKVIGGISGFHLNNGNQRELIKSVTAEIQKDLPLNRLLDEEDYTVGLEHRVEEMMKRLDFQANDVRIVGIHGIGGLGKTTLAKAAYNRSHCFFEACSFIENVREVSKTKGLVQLQQQLIQDISKRKQAKEINNSSQGTEMIKQMVGFKRVLLVLDDVDEQEQLDGLACSLRWFHSGSRIIITTRQEEILKFAGLQDEAVYMLEELDEKESLQLFNYHAFGGDKSQEECVKLSKEVVSISNGLPLVLEAFGSLFRTAKTPEEWNKLLKDLRLHQHSKVHEKLRICYDSLDEREKLIFLDIACLLVGKNSEDAIYMWEDRYSISPASEVIIRSLQNRSLIKISNGKFEMHDQIRDMGREIVLRENLLHPSSRSRLWRKEDVEKASSMSQGNEIQGILLNLREGSEMELSTQAFGLMAQLRVLLINASFSDVCDFRHFPASLKWLEWKWCTLGELPIESKFKNIVVLNLSHSFISQLWGETTTESSSMPAKEMFNGLKVLDLSCCNCLNAISNFAMAPNLEKLILDECSNLKEVDDSIATLKKLVFLSMRGCVSLKKLPSKIYELCSLKVFNLEGCSKLVAFPPTNSTNGLSILQELILRGCARLEFVPQLREFRSLRSLDMDGCQSLDHTRDLLFEDDVAVREWDELSMSESQTQLHWKEEFSFMLPFGSVNDPLLLKQLLCHSHDDPINKGTMILRVRYEDIANGDWVETRLEAHCDDSFGNDDIYGYMVRLPWDDKVSEVSRSTSIKMKVRTASDHVLTKVDVKLQKRNKFICKNMKSFICVSRKSGSPRPEFSIFINLQEEYKPDVIKYPGELDDRIGKLRRLDVRVKEQMPLFGWTIKELVILSLIFSDVKVSWYEQWPGTALPRQAREKVFDKVKVLDLSHCKLLVKTPDFARTPHLERLILDQCECLVEIGESIRQLKKLTLLSIVGCTKLRILPFAILQLNSLRCLNLTKCSEFANILPEASMTDASSDALHELILDGCTSLRKLPECVGRLKSLVRLSLRGCDNLKQLPDSIECLVALEELILDGCVLLERLPDYVGRLQSIRGLYLRGCRSVKQLPDSVGSLETLEELMLDDCRLLASLPDSIGNLKRLTKMQATGCPFLKSMPDLLNLTALEELNIGRCTNLIRIPGLQNLRTLKVLDMHRCGNLDLDSIWSQLEAAAWPHLESFSISKVWKLTVNTIQIPFPPLHLRKVVLRGSISWKDVLEIKVGEESVGYFNDSPVTFTDDDEINKRLRVLATASRDDACPRFQTLSISCPSGTCKLLGADIWFHQSLASK